MGRDVRRTTIPRDEEWKMSTDDHEYHTEVVARTQITTQACRGEIIEALEQQLPAAVIVACLVDSIVRAGASPEVRLKVAAVINREVHAIATEWREVRMRPEA